MKILFFIFSITFLSLSVNAQTKKKATSGNVKQFSFLMDSTGTKVFVYRDSAEYYMVALFDAELNSATCKAIDEEIARTNEQDHRTAGVSVISSAHKEIAYRPYKSKKWITVKK